MTTIVRERVRHRLWRVASYVTTPLVPADYLDLVSPLRPGADLRARVVEVRPETRDAVTLVLRPGASWRGHVPGQYIRIGLDVDGVRYWRAYSLTSPVDAPDGCISVTVKAIPDGLVSTYVRDRVRPGQLVHLDQATGDFTLPARRPGKVLFITAGSGITPVMGMLRNAVHELDDVVLVHCAPTAADVDTSAWLSMTCGAWSYHLPAEPEAPYPIDVWYRVPFAVREVPAALDLIVDGFAGAVGQALGAGA